jgi:hypothetical protein
MILMTRMTATLALTLTLVSAGTSAFAHGDEPHPNTLKAVQGGQLGVAGSYSYELVIAKGAKEGVESPVVVYVTDHVGKKIPTAGASGTATILAGKQKYAVVLQPDGDNRMKGVAKYAVAPDMKVLIAVKLSGSPTEQTRFTPLAASKDGHTDHTH